MHTAYTNKTDIHELEETLTKSSPYARKPCKSVRSVYSVCITKTFHAAYSAATVTVTTQVDSIVMSGLSGCEATKR